HGLTRLSHALAPEVLGAQDISGAPVRTVSLLILEALGLNLYRAVATPRGRLADELVEVVLASLHATRLLLGRESFPIELCLRLVPSLTALAIRFRSAPRRRPPVLAPGRSTRADLGQRQFANPRPELRVVDTALALERGELRKIALHDVPHNVLMPSQLRV